MPAMRNIQIIDRADNATFSLFQATDEEFDALFPDGREMELIEDVLARLGDPAGEILSRIRERPILKRDAQGVHGTLFYGWEDRRHFLPETRREVDWPKSAINPAQRRLFAAAKATPAAQTKVEKEEPSTAGHGCLVVLLGAAGLWLILSGNVYQPFFFTLWGAAILSPIAVRKPSLWLGRPADRRADPARYWTLILAGGSLVAFGLYTLLAGS